MRWAIFGLLVLHGAIHFLGFAKAFSLVEVPQLTIPVGHATGIVWVVAGISLLAAASAWLRAPDHFWIVGLIALVVSQGAIFAGWQDARFGTLVNVVLLGVVVHAFASTGPFSFEAAFRRDVGVRLPSRASSAGALDESDLVALPAPVQRYVREIGAMSRVRDFRAEWTGRIRQGPDDPWMNFTAFQHNFIEPPARFFHMRARRGGVPVDVYHAFQDGSARMQVRLLSLFPLAAAEGDDLTRAEVVTLLNDLSILAPGALADPRVRWEAVDDTTARAFYRIGVDTVSAVLVFDDRGRLRDFVSDDRLRAAADGRAFTAERWSTPILESGEEHGYTGPTRAEARWHPPEGEFIYLEIELRELAINGSRVFPDTPAGPGPDRRGEGLEPG